jgi:hypothetical protein
MMVGMSSTRSWVAVIFLLIPRASLNAHFLAKIRTKWGTIHISGQHENERRAGGEDTTELTTEPESSMML